MWGKKELYYDPKTNVLHGSRSQRYPYKITELDPKTGRYNIIAETKTFGMAYSHPDGTHVMQTHGTNAELQHSAHVSPLAESTAAGRIATQTGVGFMVGAPIGAAVGALAGGPLGAGFGALTGGAFGAALGEQVQHADGQFLPMMSLCRNHQRYEVDHEQHTIGSIIWFLLSC